MNHGDLPATEAGENWREEPYLSMLLPASPAVDESYQSSLRPAELPVELRTPLHASVPPHELSASAKASLGLLALALFAGVTGNWLLRAESWGLNVVLWLGLFLLACWASQRVSGAARLPRYPWIISGMLCFASGLVWRASPVLQGLDLLVLLVLAVLLVLYSHTGQGWQSTLLDYAAMTWRTGHRTLCGAFKLLHKDIEWRTWPLARWSTPLLAYGRGLLLAIPLLIVFGLLLMAADEVFASLVGKLFSFNPVALLAHLLTITGITWFTVGYLRGLTDKPVSVAATTRPTNWKLGIVEIGIVLALLDVLFLAFVIVQFQYLFFAALHFKPGSASAYANYARRGFFELVTVATLVLPLLLGTHWLLDKTEPRHERLFRYLAGGQIVLLFVIMASAVYRMRLYQLSLGLTELRVYTMAFMTWLALVFGWFSVTVLRNQRAYFASGATIAGLFLIGVLHWLNPDALIVHTNLERARAGQPFDAYYNATLSADSIPTLVAGFSHANPTDQATLRANLLAREAEFKAQSWRAWNWSRQQARQHLNHQ